MSTELFEYTLQLIENEEVDKKYLKKLRKCLKELGRQCVQLGNLDLAMRAYSKAFSSCINAKADGDKKSKVFGVYLVANLQFASHFMGGSRQLCGNIIKVLESRPLPNLELFPKEDQLLYNYYCGMYFMSEDSLERAYSHLKRAFSLINSKHKLASKILHRLIPLKLLKGELPSISLLTDFPDLSRYNVALQSLRSGNLKNFNNFMIVNQAFLIDQETLFVFEKLQFVVLRHLLKKCFQMANNSSQVSLNVFKRAIEVSNQMEIDDIQYYNWMSNLVERGYLRSNVFLAEQIIAFDPNNPFPTLNTISLN